MSGFPNAQGNATKLQGRNVSNAAPANNNVLTWVAANNDWEPQAGGGGGGGADALDTYIVTQAGAHNNANDVFFGAVNGYGTLASRPASAIEGYIWFASDTFQFYRWTSAAWVSVTPLAQPDATKLAIANNLSDLNNVATARTNLQVGGYGLFGDGSDGTQNFDGSSTITLGGGGTLVPAAGVYTLTRDIFLAGGSQLTNGGTAARIETAGYRVFCSGTLTIAATCSITAQGNNGSSNTAGAATTVGIIGAGSNGVGRAGGAGVVGAGAGAAGSGASPGLGGSGGAGGTNTGSGTGGGTGGGSTTGPTAAQGQPRYLPFAIAGTSPGSLLTGYYGGSGGSGGTGNTSQTSGGGGGGGGICVVVAFHLVNNGTITATGGNGGNASGAGNAGGGGGGGGGAVFIVTGPGATVGTATAAGGTGGTRVGTGANGANGSAGTVYTFTV